MIAAPPSPQKAEGPFGRLEQRELEYMSLCDFAPLDRLLCVVLRARVDGRTKKVHDRIDTLARWSGMSTRSVQRSLGSLEQRGTIARHRHRISGGARGQAFTWSTTLVPYEGWPTAPLECLVIGMSVYLRVFHQLGERATGASPSGKNMPKPTEEPARIAGRTRLATRDSPESYPETSPERGAASESRREADEDGDAVLEVRVLRASTVGGRPAVSAVPVITVDEGSLEVDARAVVAAYLECGGDRSEHARFKVDKEAWHLLREGEDRGVVIRAAQILARSRRPPWKLRAAASEARQR